MEKSLEWAITTLATKKSLKLDESSPLSIVNEEIRERRKKRPFRKLNFQSCLTPGSWRSVLNRRKKEFGCLFWESKAKENGIIREKIDGNFRLFAKKRFKKVRKFGYSKPIQRLAKPIVQFTSVCLFCKTNSVIPRIQGKLGRKHSYIDINRNNLGVMITNDPSDFSVHQGCLDYAHGMYVFYRLINGY